MLALHQDTYDIASGSLLEIGGFAALELRIAGNLHVRKIMTKVEQRICLIKQRFSKRLNQYCKMPLQTGQIWANLNL